MDKRVYEKISELTGEKIVEWRKCRWCGEEFPIYEGDIKMLQKLSPTIGGEKFELPLPTLCPRCRQRQRMMFRNERKLYKRKCDNCGRSFISVFPPEFEGKVYCFDCWWKNNVGDKYSKDIDLSKDIMEQFKELLKETPYLGIYQISNENSSYTNYSGWNKDCYLSYSVRYSEESFYGYRIIKSKNSVDSFNTINSQNVYEGKSVVNSYKVVNGENIEDSNYVFFSDDIKGGSNIIFSSNVSGMKNVIGNKQVSKKEFEERKKELLKKLKSYEGYQELLKKYKEIRKNRKQRFLLMSNVEKSLGHHLYNAKNSLFCFYSKNLEDCRYIWMSTNSKDEMDVDYDDESFRIYETLGPEKVNDVYFCVSIWESNSTFYSLCTIQSSNMFLCCNVLGKGNCILNKEYNNKNEWERKVKAIIEKLKEEGKRGEFFPPILSPFPYNDSVAYDWYPVKEVRLVDIESLGKDVELVKNIIEKGSIGGEEVEKLREILKVNSIVLEENENGEGVVYILNNDKFITDAILDLGGDELIGVRWRTKEKEINVPEGINLIRAEDLPDNIEDLTKEEEIKILTSAIICEESGKPFRIVKAELKFYKKIGLPLPRLHPDIRFKERLQKIPKMMGLYLRKCDKCGEEILSVYPEGVEFKVYCEECYNKEIY